jgi:hypothetical protein
MTIISIITGVEYVEARFRAKIADDLMNMCTRMYGINLYMYVYVYIYIYAYILTRTYLSMHI